MSGLWEARGADVSAKPWGYRERDGGVSRGVTGFGRKILDARLTGQGFASVLTVYVLGDRCLSGGGRGRFVRPICVQNRDLFAEYHRQHAESAVFIGAANRI